MNTISAVSGNANAVQWEVINSTNAESRQAQQAESYMQNDSVVVSSTAYAEPTLIADEDVDAVMDETLSMIADDPYAALHAHSGLDASRVAALLA